MRTQASKPDAALRPPGILADVEPVAGPLVPRRRTSQELYAEAKQRALRLTGGIRQRECGKVPLGDGLDNRVGEVSDTVVSLSKVELGRQS